MAFRCKSQGFYTVLDAYIAIMDLGPSLYERGLGSECRMTGSEIPWFGAFWKISVL